MKNETLVKDLTVAELKDLIRQIVQQELIFANRNVTECKGYELKQVEFPKRCEIIWGDDDVRKIR